MIVHIQVTGLCADSDKEKLACEAKLLGDYIGRISGGRLVSCSIRPDIKKSC